MRAREIVEQVVNAASDCQARGHACPMCGASGGKLGGKWVHEFDCVVAAGLRYLEDHRKRNPVAEYEDVRSYFEHRAKASHP